MMQGLYSGASGLRAHSAGMSSVAQNLANVSTVGYKQQSTLFDDMMYQTTRAAGATTQAGDSIPVGHQTGMGVRLAATRTLFTDGSYEQGNSFTDLAITGKGFFQVSDGENVYYTRAGNFRFDAEGTLRSADGQIRDRPCAGGRRPACGRPCAHRDRFRRGRSDTVSAQGHHVPDGADESQCHQ